MSYTPTTTTTTDTQTHARQEVGYPHTNTRELINRILCSQRRFEAVEANARRYRTNNNRKTHPHTHNLRQNVFAGSHPNTSSEELSVVLLFCASKRRSVLTSACWRVSHHRHQPFEMNPYDSANMNAYEYDTTLECRDGTIVPGSCVGGAPVGGFMRGSGRGYYDFVLLWFFHMRLTMVMVFCRHR